MTRRKTSNNLLHLAGAMADAARAVVGGQGLNFTVAPATVRTLTEASDKLREAVDEYDAEIIRLAREKP